MGLSDIIVQLSKQLFPRGRAFKMPYDGAMEKLQRGLSISEEMAYMDALAIKDSLIPDNDNFTAEDASDWERRLGMIDSSAVALSDRKMAILRKMQFPGAVAARQHYLFLQGQLRDAGFDVYVFENRFVELQPELVPDPVIANGGTWYDGNNNPFTSPGSIFIGNLAGGTIKTGQILETGKKYRTEIIFGGINYPSVGRPVVLSAGNNVVATITTTGTYTVDFTYLGGDDRLSLFDANPFSSILIRWSVKELKLVTKTPFEVSGDPSLTEEVQFGDIEYGEGEYGVVDSNKIANHIDEEKDLFFSVGDNLRSTFFIGGTPVGTFADVPLARKDEFRQLVLRLKPAQTVAFTFINYV